MRSCRRDRFRIRSPVLAQLCGAFDLPVRRREHRGRGTGEPLFGQPYTVKRLSGGLRVGIVGVLDDAIRFPAYIDTSKFKVLPAAESLQKLLPELRRQSDFLILLSHMGMERSRELARQMPGFGLMVIGHGKPIIKKLEKQGETILLATGGDGQYLGRIDLSLSGGGVITWGELRIVPLEDPSRSIRPS